LTVAPSAQTHLSFSYVAPDGPPFIALLVNAAAAEQAKMYTSAQGARD
jgi:hypothetical protein